MCLWLPENEKPACRLRQTGFCARISLPDCRRGLAVPRWLSLNQAGLFLIHLAYCTTFCGAAQVSLDSGLSLTCLVLSTRANPTGGISAILPSDSCRRGFESRRSRQKTDLLVPGRFFFLGIANHAQAWYNMHDGCLHRKEYGSVTGF